MTPMWEPLLGDGPDRSDCEASMVANTPIKRFAEAKEVAALTAMLDGPHSSVRVHRSKAGKGRGPLLVAAMSSLSVKFVIGLRRECVEFHVSFLR
jgi:hypothetical protein